MGETAELRKAVFKLRISDAGRIDADFVLTLCTPEGVEQWDFGWSLQDVVLESARGRSLREMFDPSMRSLFEDHMYDLAQRGLTPDRTYDELPIRVEVPSEVLRGVD
ncbi:MAG TPA: hypothetical protein VFX51_08310 [Solirubrobacteraceae bacterium]|nr:hypothetical protein [Solirubrobacteraceae bacterium]